MTPRKDEEAWGSKFSILLCIDSRIRLDSEELHQWSVSKMVITPLCHSGSNSSILLQTAILPISVEVAHKNLTLVMVVRIYHRQPILYSYL